MLEHIKAVEKADIIPLDTSAFAATVATEKQACYQTDFGLGPVPDFELSRPSRNNPMNVTSWRRKKRSRNKNHQSRRGF